MVSELNVAYFKHQVTTMMYKKVSEDSSRGNFLKATYFMHSFSMRIDT